MSSCQKFKLFNTKYKQCDALEFKKVKKRNQEMKDFTDHEKSQSICNTYMWWLRVVQYLFTLQKKNENFGKRATYFST